MTELLYMQDFDVESCDAIIKSVTTTEDGRTDIILDQTCFYPRGGGQDWDTGTIKKQSATFAVGEVRLDEAGVVHHIGAIESGSFEAGDNVSCAVDHERRVINARLHSAGHLIDMAVGKMGLTWKPGKGSHYPHMSSVEYTGEWDEHKVEEWRGEIEKRVNDLVATGTENSIKFMSVDEMHAVCKDVPDNTPTNKPSRVVIYGDDFGIPCGGTHVKNLRQVGQVTVTKLKNKKGIIKVSYAVEGIN